MRDHTCHANCPCHTGGEPVSDFVEARKPDPITVTLTREEAEVVASDIDSGQVLAFGYQVAAARRAKAKLRAALDSEATITEEMVEQVAADIRKVEQDGRAGWDWYRALARACLEAALKEDE